VLRIWIWDPGSGAFSPLDPGTGIGMKKKSGSESGMNNPDNVSKNYETNISTKTDLRHKSILVLYY
jgi:hypothetical protein